MFEHMFGNYRATIRYRWWWWAGGGGGLEFLPDHFFLFHKGDGKLYFFHPGIGCILLKPVSAIPNIT